MRAPRTSSNRSGDTWNEQQKLTAADPATDDQFGWAVAIDGDSVAVTAPRADIAGDTTAGAIYVFDRSGGVWDSKRSSPRPTLRRPVP